MRSHAGFCNQASFLCIPMPWAVSSNHLSIYVLSIWWLVVILQLYSSFFTEIHIHIYLFLLRLHWNSCGVLKLKLAEKFLFLSLFTSFHQSAYSPYPFPILILENASFLVAWAKNSHPECSFSPLNHIQTVYRTSLQIEIFLLFVPKEWCQVTNLSPGLL